MKEIIDALNAECKEHLTFSSPSSFHGKEDQNHRQFIESFFFVFEPLTNRIGTKSLLW